MVKPDPDKDDRNGNKFLELSFYRAYAIYTGIVFQLVMAIVLGVLGGRYLDQKLDTQPVFLVVGVVLGSTLGFYNLFRLLKYHQSKQDEKKD